MDNVLPDGYRFRFAFLWRPTEIAGRTRRLESVRVIQRVRVQSGFDIYPDREEWIDVGFWDEVFPSLAKDAAGFGELWP